MSGRLDKAVMLAAGGTGGHLFPAEALAHELKRRGHAILLMTDSRAEKYANAFPADRTVIVPSATFASKNPFAVMRTLWTLYKGMRMCGEVLRAVRPVAAVGFGGYPTLPPIVSARKAGIAVMIHEQNAILGRANRFLARHARAVAVGFPQVGEVPKAPVIETGNPVRPMVDAVRDMPYPERQPNEILRLVIFGGSQGARFFSQALPPALALLTMEERRRLSILQQAREEDQAQLVADYGELGISADISPFFPNMPEEIARSHFVIARAGASSVTELAVIGRPSLLVPLPGSLDGDQAANAIAMAQADGAFVVKQGELDAERLAGIIRMALGQPHKLAEMAANAKRTGIADAARRLADCVECVISGGDPAKLEF